MAAEFVTLRDGIRPSGQPLPPGTTYTTNRTIKTPSGNMGSFLLTGNLLCA